MTWISKRQFSFGNLFQIISIYIASHTNYNCSKEGFSSHKLFYSTRMLKTGKISLKTLFTLHLCLIILFKYFNYVLINYCHFASDRSLYLATERILEANTPWWITCFPDVKANWTPSPEKRPKKINFRLSVSLTDHIW